MSSPWSRAGSPSGTLPPPPAPSPKSGTATSPGAPFPVAFPQGAMPRRRVSARTALGLLLAIALSAAITATITILLMRSNTTEQPSGQASSGSAASASAPATPQFSAAESAAAKARLCGVFDTSVRGQESQGGLRMEGNLNLPLILRGVNSASAVQNALIPAVPPEIADAAHKYISATLDQTTAAMGNTPTPEVNRLTDVRNSATYALADACGLPR